MVKTRARAISHVRAPLWSVDPNVRNFLRSVELELEVVADEKYLKGAEDRPLIIVRRARERRASP
jgi:hypothetical protein